MTHRLHACIAAACCLFAGAVAAQDPGRALGGILRSVIPNTLPAARPAATLTMFCSAILHSKNRFGKAFANMLANVELLTSPSTARRTVRLALAPRGASGGGT